jgi:hypothetical protein
MERRTALAYAAAAAGIALAGSTAFAATSGMLGPDDPDPVEIEGISTAGGDLVPDTTTTLPESSVVTVVVDEYVTAPGASGGSGVDDRGGLRLAGVSDDDPSVLDDSDDLDHDDLDDRDDDVGDDHDVDRDDEDDDHDEVEVEVEDD